MLHNLFAAVDQLHGAFDDLLSERALEWVNNGEYYMETFYDQYELISGFCQVLEDIGKPRMKPTAETQEVSVLLPPEERPLCKSPLTTVYAKGDYEEAYQWKNGQYHAKDSRKVPARIYCVRCRRKLPFDMHDWFLRNGISFKMLQNDNFTSIE